MSEDGDVVQFRFPRRARRWPRPSAPPASGSKRWGAASARSPIACAIGACRASAIGAVRSRSSIARDCGIVPVPEGDLPVDLPEDVSFDGPGNPLDHHPTWKYVACPRCDGPAERETDTFDTFFESSWYFLRFCSARAPVAFERASGRLLDAGRPVYRRHRARRAASALFALLHPRAEAMRLSRSGRAVRRPVHARHGVPPDLSQRGPATGCFPRRSRRDG